MIFFLILGQRGPDCPIVGALFVVRHGKKTAASGSKYSQISPKFSAVPGV